MIKPKILTEIEKIPGIESQLNDKAKQVDVNNALALKRDKSIPIDLTDFTDAAKQAIAGTASIYPSFADKSVTPTKATFFQTGKNKFNKKAATVGYYVNQTTGELAANAGHTVSDWILIELNTEYIPSISCRYAFYDSAKIFISGGYPATGTSFTSPANAKYLRVSYENVTSTLDTFQVEKGNVRTYYENYIEYIPLDYIEKTEDKYVEKLTYSIGSEDISTATYPVITSGGITRVDGNPCNGDGFL
jgi:hypothetical protein